MARRRLVAVGAGLGQLLDRDDVGVGRTLVQPGHVARGIHGRRQIDRCRSRDGSKRTVAVSVARLTSAPSTPSTFCRNRVIRLTHEAQVIPSTGNEMISIGWVVAAMGSCVLVVVVMLVGSGYSLGVSSHADPPSVE